MNRLASGRVVLVRCVVALSVAVVGGLSLPAAEAQPTAAPVTKTFGAKPK